MIKKQIIKYAGIIMVIAISLSCTLCSTISKAADTKQNLLNQFLRQESEQSDIPVPSTSEEPPITTLDTAITSSYILSATEHDITIKWDDVPDAEGYELSISYNDTSYTVETVDTTFTISSLEAATICSYQIRYFKTVLGVKTYSKASDVFLASTTVNKVTGLSVTDRTAPTPDNAAISLLWDASNNASYKIYYKAASEDTFSLSGETTVNSYTIEGLNASEKYDIFVQAYCLNETNTGAPSDTLTTYTCPAIVTNFYIVSEESHVVNLAWDANSTATSYYIYRSVNDSPFEFYKITTETKLSETELTAGTVYSYMICSYFDTSNLQSPVSDVLRAVTTPYVTTGLVLSENTANSIHLTWDYNETATGYIIYRRRASGEFEYIDSTTETSYTDTRLDSGKNYRYKIMTYADTEEHTSDFGDVAKTSTLPAKVNLNGKSGYGKLRLSWKKVSGAAGYYIYLQDGDDFSLIDTIEDAKTVSMLYENLTIGETYKYNVVAYRNAFNEEFISEESIVDVVPRTMFDTTTVPSYYKTKKQLVNSDAWKNVPIIKKSANYEKSYTIPGIRSTNVDGFESKSMCPQGLTFAKNYLLISAYDTYGEENSVIYVLDKEFKDLLTVIVLPNKTHAGGIAFDGENVWITNGKKICTIDFNELDEAAKEYAVFKTVQFTGTYELEQKASFLEWYKDRIWAGSFESAENGTLRSYSVAEDEENNIILTKQSSVTIPPAVQGVTFNGNKMILSRAYGYTNELNIYKVSNIGKDNMKIGNIKKTVTMPALNEEIAISGKYLFVNFESATPNSKALNHMDRVVAIKLNAILKNI